MRLVLFGLDVLAILVLSYPSSTTIAVIEWNERPGMIPLPLFTREQQSKQAVSAAKSDHYAVDDKGGAVGQHQHVEELDGGPLPTVGLAADDGHGGGALHGEGEEDHQGQRAAEGHVVMEGGLQVHGLGCRVGAVEGAHGADHDLAGQDAGEQADADLPVEAEGGNGGLDEVAEAADEAVGEFRRGDRAARSLNHRHVGQYPKGQSDAEDDGSGLAQEDARAVYQTEGQGAQGGHAVLGQLKDERRLAGLEDGAFQQPCGGHGPHKAGHIEAEHDDGAQAEKAVQVDDVGDEGGDHQHVNRQARGAGHERRDQNGRHPVTLVLDGARGHDGRHGAGVGREQRDKGLAVEPGGAHDAVGDQGGAGQVAGVFKNADEEKEEQDLGQKDEHGGDALPGAVEDERLQPAGGQQGADQVGGAGQDVAKAVRKRLADGEDHLKDAHHHEQKEQRPPDAVQQNVVDLAGVFDRERGLIASVAADLRG